MEVWSLTKEDMENNMDNAKTVILKGLVADGLIDKTIADDWCANNTIIIRKKGIFRTISNKWLKIKKTEEEIMIVVTRKDEK